MFAVVGNTLRNPNFLLGVAAMAVGILQSAVWALVGDVKPRGSASASLTFVANALLPNCFCVSEWIIDDGLPPCWLRAALH